MTFNGKDFGRITLIVFLMVGSYVFGTSEVATATNDKVAVNGLPNDKVSIWMMRDRTYLIKVHGETYCYVPYSATGSVYSASVPNSFTIFGHMYAFSPSVLLKSGGIVPLEHWDAGLRRDGVAIWFRTIDGVEIAASLRSYQDL